MTRGVRPALRRAAIVAFIILLPVGAHALWDYVEVRRLIREVASIRDRGEPVTNRDLGPTVPTSEEQKRASRLYLAAAALTLDTSPDDYKIATDLRSASPRLAPRSPERDELVRRVEEALARYSDAFPLLDKATPLDFSVPAPGTEHSYRTASLWSLSHVNSLRSAHYCLTDRADAAAEATLATLRLQRVFGPSLSWIWMQPNTIGIDFLLSHCSPSTAALIRLQGAIGVTDGRAAVLGNLLSERVHFINRMWRYYGVDARSPEHFEFRHWTAVEVIRRPWLTHLLVRQLKLRAEAIAAARQPRRQRQEQLDVLTRLNRQPATLGRSPLEALSATTMIGLEVPQAEARVTFSNVWRAAIAIERYRRDNGQRLPPALSDLVPAYLEAVPVDPYSESRLLYKPMPNGYTVYSVGANLADDGGDVTPAKPDWPRRSLVASAPDLGVLVRTTH